MYTLPRFRGSLGRGRRCGTRLVLTVALAVSLSACGAERTAPPPTSVDVGGRSLLLPIPDGWTSNALSERETALLPPGKAADQALEYSGDLIVEIHENPRRLAPVEYFRQQGKVPYLDAVSAGVETRTIGDRTSIITKDVPGPVPSTVAILDFGDSYITVTDVNNNHQDDGVFLSLVDRIEIRR